jgi:hypothetical protein
MTWPTKSQLTGGCGKLQRDLRASVHLTVSLAAGGLLVMLLNLPIGAASPTEYQVKAAYLFNFGRFVQWPSQGSASQNTTFPICVLGADPFGKTLDETIAGQSIDSKAVVARRINDAGDAAGCRVLFISTGEGAHLKSILNNLDSLSILTVSDMPDFMDHGGMIQFIERRRRVRFAINLAAAHRAGLSLSSELLKVALRVEEADRPRG